MSFSKTSPVSSVPKPEDAYAAGLIDGEGCIAIEGTSRQGKKFYRVIVTVGMSDKGLPCLQWLVKHYGGKIWRGKARTARWNASSRWMLYGEKTREFLTALLPYLLIKQPQCRLALDLLNLIDTLPQKGGKRQWTEEARAQGLTMKALMHQLNLRGPNQIPWAPPGAFAQLVDGVWMEPMPDLFGTLRPYSGDWPSAGMMSAGAVWGLMTSAPPTTANGSGYWRTPNAYDAQQRHNEQSTSNRMARGKTISLGGQVKTPAMWPTPQAFDANDIQRSPAALARAKTMGGCANLREAVQAWATPTSNDAKNNASTSQEGRHGPALNVQAGGSLNPDWVEAYLMAWPLGWSGAGPLNPQTFHAWLRVFQTALHACAPWVTGNSPYVRPSPGGY